MTWLLKLVTGNPMVMIWLIAGSFGIGLTAGGVGAWKYQGARLDAVKAEYKGFVDTVKVIGEAAQKAAKEKEARDKDAKTKADNENIRSMDSMRATIQRLRNSRTNSNYLPAPAPGASSPATATINRAEFERAMGTLDSEVQGFLETGDKAIIDLDTVKLWAADALSLKVTPSLKTK